MIAYRILHLDGTPWMMNVGDFMGKWRWITERMMELYDCDYADVDVLESEAHGDILIVCDKAVGLLPAPKPRFAPVERLEAAE
jgi:hypothetical protein